MKNKIISAVCIVVVMLIVIVTSLKSGAGISAGSNAIYAKDNALYISDGSTNTKLTNSISDGGSYSYYYMGWGVEYNEDKTGVFFQSNVDENSNFILNYQDLESGEKVVIAENVYGFKSDGTKAVVYIKDVEQGLGTLAIYVNGSETIIDKDISSSQAIFEISGDGENIAYLKTEDGIECLYLYSLSKQETQKIGENVPQFILPKASQGVYFVEADKENTLDYNICISDFNWNKEVLATRATALLALENEQDGFLYMTNVGEDIKYSEILEDDLYESDKLISNPDAKSYSDKNIDDYNADVLEYESKLARDEIRSHLDGESFYDHNDQLYLYQNGKSSMVVDGALDAKSIDGKGEVIAYSKNEEFEYEKTKISEIYSIEELMELYYYQLNASPKDVYISVQGKEPQVLTSESVSLNDIYISEDNSLIAFLANYSEDKGTSELYQVEVSKNGTLGEVVKVAENVYSAAISPVDNVIAYMTGFDGLSGTLNAYKNNKSTVISESADNYRFGAGNSTIYYTSDFNAETLEAVLYSYQDGKNTKIDESVLIIDCKDNDILYYIRNYNLETNIGDLYINKNGKSELLEKGISCMFFI